MTLKQAVDRADETRQNQFGTDLKRAWLTELDGQLRQEVFAACEGELPAFVGYGAQTDPDTELLVPSPWDGLYVQYLVLRIDLENGELARYNAGAQCFNRALQSFAGHYFRTHTPRGVQKLRF